MKLLLLLELFFLVLLSATIIAHAETTRKTPTNPRRAARFPANPNPSPNPNPACNRFPRVCQLKGSEGPDCCKKKCVDVKTDRLNCGACGVKCKYTQICCKGKCVSPWFDKRHCGGCNKRCNNGEFCSYGMCNYA